MTLFDSLLNSVVKAINFAALFRALIIVIIGYIIANMTSQALTRVFAKFRNNHFGPLIGKITFYAIITLFTLSALREFGFDLRLLLGAAGIFTVAIGFASQTTASNFISGLFLVGERPFTLGETIVINDTIGEVLSVDLLSTKLKTADNTLIRIPNEMLLKTQISNLSRFPIRRFDCNISVAYQEEIAKVNKILLAVAKGNPLCLSSPEPSLLILGFGDDGINLQFSVWGMQKDFNALKNLIQGEIKIAFEQNQIQMPFPMRKIIIQHEPQS